MAHNLATCVSRDFASHARGLDQYVYRLERAYAIRALSTIDLGRVYAGGMLNFAATLESSIERLFVGLAVGRLQVTNPPATPRVRVGTTQIARELITLGKPFASWLPFEKTQERAEIFFRSGYPFDRLTPQQLVSFEHVRVIRNAIAHESEVAMVQFKKKILSGLSLPPSQMSPVGYLRGQHAGSQNRFNALLAQCVQSMMILCS